MLCDPSDHVGYRHAKTIARAVVLDEDAGCGTVGIVFLGDTVKRAILRTRADAASIDFGDEEASEGIGIGAIRVRVVVVGDGADFGIVRRQKARKKS